MCHITFHKPGGVLVVDTDNRPAGLTAAEEAECDRQAAMEQDTDRITELFNLGVGTLTSVQKDELLGLLAKQMNDLY